MHRLPLTLAALSLFGCHDVYVDPEGGRAAQAGKFQAGSCALDDGDACGTQSPDGCWCDEQCVQYGDCCADIEPVCDAPEEPPPVEAPPEDAPSCATDDGGDVCGGQSADGCWCDEQCVQFGDCCPDVADVCDAEPEPTGCSGSRSYTVVVDLLWDPSGVPNPHFSPLIGGTHDAATVFWAPGALATPGIEVMAETGDPSPLAAEVSAAIAAGGASAVLQGGGLPSTPISTQLTFEVDGDHSQVTLVTMVAPSPDWFVGVGNLELCEDGAWVEPVVPLTVWDAGTDSGADFTSPNADTFPAQPIAISDAFSGPVGSMTFLAQ